MAEETPPPVEMPDPSGEEVALEIIDAAVSSAFAVVHESELAASVLSFSVSTIISDLYRTVDWANLPTDEGNADCAVDRTWRAEDELQPAPIDKWARGAVKTRRKTKKRAEIDSAMSLKSSNAHPATPSESSIGGGRAKRSAQRRTLGSAGSQGRGASMRASGELQRAPGGPNQCKFYCQRMLTLCYFKKPQVYVPRILSALQEQH